mmetsp:Transcript_9541/g.14165  ORF Transcript_9541/g.14165 Transcript_9541/m.14165 type:complete len:262 (+) Transcript_9541:745-1530(+)
MSWVSCAMRLVSSSFCKVSCCTPSVFSSRVSLLVDSSVSHQPLCSISSVDSFIRVEMRSLIIFLTLVKGSAATCMEACSRKRLLRSFALCSRNSATRFCKSCVAELLSCARARWPTSFWRSIVGRCLSATPETPSLEMISMASERAAISSSRSFLRELKSSVFCMQRIFVSSRYFLSSPSSFSASAFSPSFVALASCVLDRSVVFLFTSCFAFSTLSVSCWAMFSKACLAVISSLSRVYFWLENWSLSFSSMSMTPPDWNS